MTRIALLRHGHTSWNREGRIQGRTDMPLDPEAADTLRRLVLPANWRAADIFSSPLKRAHDTARLVTGRAPTVSQALIEMNWGEWEGQRGHDLKAAPDSGFRDIENWGWTFCPPGGETLVDLRDRVLNWAETRTHDTLAVTHIGVMRVFLAVATDWDFQGPAPFRIKRNRLYVLTRNARQWHLDAEPVRLDEVSRCA